MKYDELSTTVSIKTISETAREGVFEVEGLYSGYGITVGNALRRVLLSSLPGAAITQVKITGANHEFGTIPNVEEDIVEIILNLKRVRFSMHTDEPRALSLHVKGERAVTARDIEADADFEVVTPDAPIATISAKSGDLAMELTVERGLGYVAAESRKAEKLPIGTIALDAIFSPVMSVNFTVENMRIEDRTDYHRIRIAIVTDGSITPSYALQRAATILAEHFTKAASLAVAPFTPPQAGAGEEVAGTKAPKKAKATRSKKKSE